MAASKESTIKGKTDAEFDGVTLGTLDAWLRFWNNEDRSKDAASEERPREVHIAMIEAEIAARRTPAAVTA